MLFQNILTGLENAPGLPDIDKSGPSLFLYLPDLPERHQPCAVP
jgi:hypothetical protein